MPTLHDYDQFDGYHWESGAIHNYYAYQGVKAPHTGEPYSEALFLGVSGGVAMGYFTFHYEGYDPQCNILTRNTFDPQDKMLSRLGIVQDVEHTSSTGRATEILLDTLAAGTPAIVWADPWRLPYNGLARDDALWGMLPLVVYGYEPEQGIALVADRAQVPLTVSTGELDAARARIKKEKHRLLTLDVPDPARLPSAVRLGIGDCIRLFTEKPPRGSRHNFGLAAYQYWARMLVEPKQRSSWDKLFPPGVPLYAGLTSAYTFGFLFGKGLAGDGERGLYADFLEEAALLLNNPALSAVATRFRRCAEAWRGLPRALLPDEVAPFSESRELMWRRHELFLRAGGASLEERRRIDERLAALRESMARDFPLDGAGVVALRERIAEQLLVIHDEEQAAVQALQEAVT